MKKYVHSATSMKVTKQMIKDAIDNQWPLDIDTPNLIAWTTDSDAFFVVNLDKAVDYLNSPEGQPYVDDDLADLDLVLFEAWDAGQFDGMERYSFSNDLGCIIQKFEDAGQEVPGWMIDEMNSYY